jgi:hypothetical protein
MFNGSDTKSSCKILSTWKEEEEEEEEEERESRADMEHESFSESQVLLELEIVSVGDDKLLLKAGVETGHIMAYERRTYRSRIESKQSKLPSFLPLLCLGKDLPPICSGECTEEARRQRRVETLSTQHRSQIPKKKMQ